MTQVTLTSSTSNSGFWNNVGQYSKGIVAVASAIVGALTPYYGSQPWFVGLVAGLGALIIILVPNQPKG